MSDDLTDYLGAALSLEVRLGEQTSQTTERAMQHAATALRNAHDNRNRLAALAGAAPMDGFVTFENRHMKLDVAGYLASDAGKENLQRVLAASRQYEPHAPAKAREDELRERLAALPRYYRESTGEFIRADDIDAALATFAEGE